MTDPFDIDDYIRHVHGLYRFGASLPVGDTLDWMAEAGLDDESTLLVSAFDALVRDFRHRPVPVYEEPKPVSGEIPWRTLHRED